ncbi:NAD(P)H-dependent oxidoreductase [Streptomyces sp. NPDC096012]|uniref:flavodoxin family protein n=1 Tax=Streptomyces sp. NPDC096012 TaxID=3155684 RepID=UPI00336A8989
MSHRIAVVYHSRRGSVRALAALAAEGARETGAEVRLLRVADDEAAGRRWPERVAEPEDVVWADGLVLASPTYYGNVSSAFKRFLESTAPLWRQGLLADRVATGITVSTQRHGGREATLTALQHTLYHWGCWVAGADPADPVTRAAGGTPYGLAADNRQGAPAPHERAAARSLGHRLATLAARARATPRALAAVRGQRPAPSHVSATSTASALGVKREAASSEVGPDAVLSVVPPCAAGSVGPSGAAGSVGLSGAGGPVGQSGAGGPVGSPGAAGSVGLSGAAGPVGSPGAAGSVGLSGAFALGADSGAVGPRAATGLRRSASGPGPGPVRLVVVYHGEDAATRVLAQEAAAAARAIGARVRLRRVPGRGGARSAEWPGPWAASAEPEDIAWADAVLLGARARLGALGAPLLDFVQTLEPAHAGRGPLWGKPASGFATTPARHAGSETAVLDLGHMLLHAGALLVPPGYTDPAVEAAGGNPYGASHPRCAGDLPTPEALAAAAHQGRRTALAGDLLRRAPLPGRAVRQDSARPDPEPGRLAPRTTGRSTA